MEKNPLTTWSFYKSSFRQRIPTRQREPEPKREPERERESFLSKASQERRRDEETNDESVADDSEVDDVDSEEYRKQKIKEKILRKIFNIAILTKFNKRKKFRLNHQYGVSLI